MDKILRGKVADWSLALNSIPLLDERSELQQIAFLLYRGSHSQSKINSHCWRFKADWEIYVRFEPTNKKQTPSGQSCTPMSNVMAN
jgi:hypothetical protein